MILFFSVIANIIIMELIRIKNRKDEILEGDGFRDWIIENSPVCPNCGRIHLGKNDPPDVSFRCKCGFLILSENERPYYSQKKFTDYF